MGGRYDADRRKSVASTPLNFGVISTYRGVIASETALMC